MNQKDYKKKFLIKLNEKFKTLNNYFKLEMVWNKWYYILIRGVFITYYRCLLDSLLKESLNKNYIKNTLILTLMSPGLENKSLITSFVNSLIINNRFKYLELLKLHKLFNKTNNLFWNTNKMCVMIINNIKI